MNHASDVEFLLAQKTAEEYQARGYDVLREVPLDFFLGFRADLVVKKGTDKRVIEVKKRSSLAADPRIRELAQLIDAKPEWSFDLLLVAEPEKLDSPAGAHPFAPKDIAKRIEEAEEACRLGLLAAAFIMAWSALEAVARILSETQGASAANITTSAFALEQAFALGVLPTEDYEQLTEIRKLRNAVVHGFSVREVDEGLVRDLIRTVRRLQSSAAA